MDKVKMYLEGAQVPKFANEGDIGMDLVATRGYYHVKDSEGNEELIPIEKGFEEDIATKNLLVGRYLWGYVYHTGIFLESNKDVFIFPRSSIYKKAMVLANSVGVVDRGYRGELMVKFKPTIVLQGFPEGYNITTNINIYLPGDKIAQLVFLSASNPEVEVVETLEQLSSSQRGDKGWGSTGN